LIKAEVQGLPWKYLTDPTTKEAYVCGVVPTVKAVKPLLMELGVPRGQIHTKKYPYALKPSR